MVVVQCQSPGTRSSQLCRNTSVFCQAWEWSYKWQHNIATQKVLLRWNLLSAGAREAILLVFPSAFCNWYLGPDFITCQELEAILTLNVLCFSFLCPNEKCNCVCQGVVLSKTCILILWNLKCQGRLMCFLSKQCMKSCSLGNIQSWKSTELASQWGFSCEQVCMFLTVSFKLVNVVTIDLLS